VNRRLFGGFVEHMGRGIYGGIYDPQHPAADDEGFRSDVIELVRELGMTVFRYPGGNFVSGFKWEDGIGPRESRPRRLNLPWHSVETNAFGLHEFVSWVEKVDGEVMLAANLGTRGILEALDLLEYANIPGGTDWSETRRQNGSDAPFNIRMWCLGNELDGPWQLGAMTADDYGKLAGRTAKAMRRIDPDLELIACGSSGSWMPTFGEWERTVLRHTYDDVKYISCHAYYQPRDGDMASYLGSSGMPMRCATSWAATRRCKSRSTNGMSGTTHACPHCSPSVLTTGPRPLPLPRTTTRSPTAWSWAICSSRCSTMQTA
jgi:alpha-N-arabinofuranosidase